MFPLSTSMSIWLAGAGAGLGVNVVLYPLDTLKTRIQAPDSNAMYVKKAIWRNRSLYRGLYQGIGSLLITSVPASGVFFTVYEGFKYTLLPTSIPSPLIYGISSTLAQIITSAIVIPGEVIKQNAQVIGQSSNDRGKSSQTFAVAKEIVKRDPLNLWRGYSALLIRDIPFTALQFPLLERIKKMMSKEAQLRKQQRGCGPTLSLSDHVKIATLSASIAGSAAAWITTPADVVKTRLMLKAHDNRQNWSKQKDISLCNSRNNVSRGTWSVAHDIWVKEGLRGLFRGGFIRTAWTAVGNGIFIGVYEGAKISLGPSTRTDSS
ncbi:Mitochondrial carrier [Glarea lozoyensis ATCC 20868]|uniref:Mitochondrial carrier n=1 Tax=Glarea lozoyensis (strain ATCC 20868 / MF5171) TaxID=1116229 RepID=S3DUF2_GLAL2|nr:Mitochondrial carrier [Glarea lozoyensis ATCC 20868]EPE30058.1 Mitochondrial carrier [Glarea lozoyensis ATCC 20868]